MKKVINLINSELSFSNMATLINLDQSIVNESETQSMSRHRAEPLSDYFPND
jgi:hypothetical protein